MTRTHMADRPDAQRSGHFHHWRQSANYAKRARAALISAAARIARSHKDGLWKVITPEERMSRVQAMNLLLDLAKTIR